MSETVAMSHIWLKAYSLVDGGFKVQVQHFALGDSCIWEIVFNIWIWVIEPRFRRS
jgi:hypothetical protein